MQTLYVVTAVFVCVLGEHWWCSFSYHNKPADNDSAAFPPTSDVKQLVADFQRHTNTMQHTA